jgi:ADP-ribose pyrophosphatase YjhB (NUDIX family)
MAPFLRELRQKVGHALLMLPSVAAVVQDDEGRVLLVRTSRSGEWDLPAGCVDPDETPEHAVIREVREETGLIVEPTGLLGVGGGPDYRVQYPNGDVVGYVSAIYECRVTGGSVAADGTEALDARFFPIDALPSLDITRIGRAMLGLVDGTASPAE